MSGGKMERSIFRCLRGWLVSSSTEGITVLGIVQTVRHCQNARKGIEDNKVTEGSNKTQNHVKIGSKIYVLKTDNILVDKKIKRQVRRVQSRSEAYLSIEMLSSRRSGGSESIQPTNTVLAHSTKKISQENAVSSSPTSPSYASEGLDLTLISKQPLYNKDTVKPFLPLDCSNFKVRRHTDDDPYYFTSVSSILRHSAVHNIAQWTDSQVEKLGAEGFSHFKEDIRQNGLDFQNLIVEYLRFGNDTLCIVNPEMEALWASVKPVIDKLENAQHFNRRVIHPHLRYAGNIDCIATYKSKCVLVEWKNTSVKKKKLKLSHNFCLKTVATLGALNFDEAWQYQMKECLLVLAYPDGSPADVHFISANDAEISWKIWLSKVKQFWKTNDLSEIEEGMIMENERKKLSDEDERNLISPQEIIHRKSDQHKVIDSQVKDPPIKNSDERAAQTCSSSNDAFKEQVGNTCGKEKEVNQMRSFREEKLDRMEQSGVDSKPKEKEGILKSLWNLWK